MRKQKQWREKREWVWKREKTGENGRRIRKKNK